MDLRGMLLRLAEIEETISITDPQEMTARAYPFLPGGNQTIDPPCFMHFWKLVQETRSNGQRTCHYELLLQFIVGRGDIDTPIYAECAAAFHSAILAAFDAKVKLGDTTLDTSNFRGGDTHQPTQLTFNAIPYIGLEYLMDVAITELTDLGA